MSSILDIDLDYFNLIENPEQRLQELLDWGDCPIAFIVEKHHKVYSRWKDRVKRGTLTQPSHILHVDEHHDMMDQKRNTNIANFMYHAMRTWKNCRVHWMVDTPIDSPAMWLDNDVWKSFSHRFSLGPNRPHGWPKPDIVSICTSPNFISNDLLQRLLRSIQKFMTGCTGEAYTGNSVSRRGDRTPFSIRLQEVQARRKQPEESFADAVNLTIYRKYLTNKD